MHAETSFPGCPSDRWSRGPLGVEELEDRIEGETQDHVEFGDDAELESEIGAIEGALEPLEESDTIEVLATLKQTRTAMTQEKLSRGLRAPVRQHTNSTSVTKCSPKPDLARMVGRIVEFIPGKEGGLAQAWVNAISGTQKD